MGFKSIKFIFLLLMIFLIMVFAEPVGLSNILARLSAFIYSTILGIVVGSSSESFPSMFRILEWFSKFYPPNSLMILKLSNSPCLLLSMRVFNFPLSILVLFRRLMMNSLLNLLFCPNKSFKALRETTPVYLLNKASMIYL
jgi:hypothetical protein